MPAWLRSADCVDGVVRAQIVKLLIIPFVCLVEAFWLGKVFTRNVIASVLVVVTGVAIV